METDLAATEGKQKKTNKKARVRNVERLWHIEGHRSERW